MQKIILAGCVLLITACKNNSEQKTVDEDSLVLEETNLLPPEARLPWKMAYDSNGNFRMQQQAALPDTATAAGIINDINILWPDVQALYQKTGGDTIYITIPDSEHLTQRMGSSGPAGYMSLVIYCLTELPGIKYVNFSFEEGDHAIPGTYSRLDFKDNP